MQTLNGKTYEMQYLTDEEAAVINAMRRGAKVTADFHGLQELEEADELMTLFNGLENYGKWIYELKSVDSIGISHWHERLHVNYFVKK